MSDNLDRRLVEILWKFHNDRLKDPSIKEMKPYIDELRAEVDKARREGNNTKLETIKGYNQEKLQLIEELGRTNAQDVFKRSDIGQRLRAVDRRLSRLNTQESEDTDE